MYKKRIALRVVVFTSLFFCCIAITGDAQTNWTKHPVPVLLRSGVFPDWKGLAVADASVLEENDTLKMWFSGSGWLTAGDDCPHVRMGYAWSLDGINWNEYAGNPVLDTGSDTSDFDYDGIETPCVIIDSSAPPAQRYKLWYAGRKARCQPINDHRFGYAYSPDGINWTKYAGNPVLSPGTPADWYNVFVSSPSVVFDNGVYKMWFGAPDAYANNQPTDGKGNIGYATSPDGINWTVYPSPVVIAGDQNNWDSAAVSEPVVIKTGNTWHLFYSALDTWAVEHFQVGYAHSADGINWIKSTLNPVLQIGGAGQWDRFWASHPAVIYDPQQNKFRMWYTGRDTANISSITGYYWDIGYAESSFLNNITGHGTAKTKLLLYPNPAGEELFVSGAAGAYVQVFDAFGSCLFDEQLPGNNRIPLSDWPAGMYFVCLKNNSSASARFVKF